MKATVFPLIVSLFIIAPIIAQDDSASPYPIEGTWIYKNDVSMMRFTISRGDANEMKICEVKKVSQNAYTWRLGHLKDTDLKFTTGIPNAKGAGKWEYFGRLLGAEVKCISNSKDSITIILPDTLTKDRHGDFWSPMEFVGAHPDLKTFINKETIAGEYTSSINGIKYEFDEYGHGVVNFKDSFSYEIPLDLYDNYRAILKIDNATGFFGESLTYGFRWGDSTIFVFKAEQNPEFPDRFIISDKPELLLNPITVKNPPTIEYFEALNNAPETWLLSEYVDLLKKTRSPEKAFNSIKDKYFVIELYRHDSNWWWQFSNFHEGGLSAHCDTSAYPGKSIIAFMDSSFSIKGTLSDPNTITLDYYSEGDSWKNKFVKATPSLKEFVNNILISGKYLNQNGDTCIFQPDGIARWGYSKPFKFEIELDFIFAYPDGFFLPFHQEVYGREEYFHFKWRDAKLYIFETYMVYPEGEGATVYKDPLLILTPVRNK